MGSPHAPEEWAAVLTWGLPGCSRPPGGLFFSSWSCQVCAGGNDPIHRWGELEVSESQQIPHPSVLPLSLSLSPSAFYSFCPKTRVIAFCFPFEEPTVQPRFFSLLSFFFFSFLGILLNAKKHEILWLNCVFIGEIYISLYVSHKAALGKREGPTCVVKWSRFTRDGDSL